MFTQIFLLKSPKLREPPARGGGKQAGAGTGGHGFEFHLPLCELCDLRQ